MSFVWATQQLLPGLFGCGAPGVNGKSAEQAQAETHAFPRAVCSNPGIKICLLPAAIRAVHEGAQVTREKCGTSVCRFSYLAGLALLKLMSEEAEKCHEYGHDQRTQKNPQESKNFQSSENGEKDQQRVHVGSAAYN